MTQMAACRPHTLLLPLMADAKSILRDAEDDHLRMEVLPNHIGRRGQEIRFMKACARERLLKARARYMTWRAT